MSFVHYNANPKAQQAFNLIQAALELADYRFKRIQPDAHQWYVWHRSKPRLEQDACILAYDGWGCGCDKWWRLHGDAPLQVLGIIRACLDDVNGGVA